ncbi:hypothetical protein LY78DRAFT_281844 [Colletotrichum sublineola]|uniref:DUF3716 domain-containing protein n=1 Tax=Colletotrichum sublineola TaxID=1173701 RepID=A0A066WX10_COLSU|nr:hypothetical protein LY78DRAFT_281844 [Colletotrichum sublineola]KDN61438.1 hypothetical protein CSUB01_00759 [Colletotrichum sublineola]
MHLDPGEGRRPTAQDEESYWQSIQLLQKEDDERLEGEFMANTKYYMSRLTDLNIEKQELERRALEVHRAIAREHKSLEEITNHFQEARKDLQRQRENHHRAVAAWFAEERRKEGQESARIAAAALAAPSLRRDVAPADPAQANKIVNGSPNGALNGAPNGAPNGANMNGDRRHSLAIMNGDRRHSLAAVNGDRRNSLAAAIIGDRRSSLHPSIPIPGKADQPPLTVIVDALGRPVGPVNRLKSSNRSIIYLSGLPQKRPVHLRDGVVFNHDDLRQLEGAEEKWMGAVIQATGLVRKQAQQCSQCARGQGPFAQCISLDIPEFQACGNCVWLRLNCCEASAAEQTPLITKFKAFNATAQETQHDRVRNGSFSLANGSFANGTATPLSLSRPNSRDKSFAEGSTATDEAEEDTTPITKATLTLKHDGKVYTHPECMEGVPVEKVDQNHPYWDPSWPEIVPMIEPTLQTWRDKLQAALEKGQNSMKFQLGRQVNRGETILKFLEDADFCPYQLLGKKYMMTRLVSYDTIFRLADTLRTLEGFKTLDITPLEWLRQRLQELIIAEGPSFNLAKTIHDFYHDSKYVALRLANGKKSIGRPSGMKMTPKDSPGSSRGTPGTKKRKLFINEEFPGASQRPLAPTPQSQPQPVLPSQTQIFQDELQRSAPPTPEFSRPFKKFKMTQFPKKAKDLDLVYDGFTDTDDYSGDHIGKHDWALSQIKSRLNTVSTGVTQYWHWIPDDGEQVFEHQVLAEGDTFTWGIYAKPVNFHLELPHVQEMRWATGTRKVIVVCKPGVVVSPDGKPRGNLLVEFKRERTKRRFLVFCSKKGVELEKIERDVIERTWDEYESPDVPAMPDSEID